MSRRKNPNGAGSIVRRSDGRYQAAAYVLMPDGTRRRRFVYGRTWEEADRKLTELRRRTQRGMPTFSDATLVGPYLESWLVGAATRLRPATVDGYTIYVRKHIVPALGAKRLSRLTAGDVRALVDGMRAAGLSARSVRYAHAVLRAALQDAVRDELVDRNVAKLVRIRLGDRKHVKPLTAAEAQHLLTSARSDRLYAAYVLLLALGLRRGELLGLRWEDADLEAGTLRIAQALQRSGGRLRLVPPKSASSRRTVPLPAFAVSALRDHAVGQQSERVAAATWTDSGLIFTTARGTPIEPRNFNRIFHALCDTTGLRRVRVHDLRHTCASLLHSLGVPARDAQEILGHSHISITLGIYTHVADEGQRRAMAKIDELFQGRLMSEMDVNPDER